MSVSRTGDFSRCTHGTRATYVYGCRCLDCTEANKGYADRARARRTLTPGDPRHGTPNAYTNYGCRCLLCSQAFVPINARGRARRKADA